MFGISLTPSGHPVHPLLHHFPINKSIRRAGKGEKKERNIYKTCIHFVKMNKSSVVMFWLHFTSNACPELFCRKCSSSSASGSLHWSASVHIYLCLSRQNHYSQCLMPESITWAPDMRVQLLSVSLNRSSASPPWTTITHTLNMY